MDGPRRREYTFQMQPELLQKQLGSDLYPSATDALAQLVANSLDAGSTRIEVQILMNQLETPELVTIADDGRGISPEDVEKCFLTVGRHTDPSVPRREIIGSRGIGRFAVHALAAESRWVTIADSPAGRVKQTWIMQGGDVSLKVNIEPAHGEKTGTSITITPKQTAGVAWLFQSPQRVKRGLFNAFASYLLRYGDDVEIVVNGESISLKEFIEHVQVEQIQGDGFMPKAELRHLVLGVHVDQLYPSMIQFASHGSTIRNQAIDGDQIPGRKYLGLVDSAYISELTNTAKSDLAIFDEKFRALEAESVQRARRFIANVRGDKGQSFLAQARSRSFYPYKTPPRTVIDAYTRSVYDNLLLSLEQGIGISSLQLKHQRLIFLLTKQLLNSEDLASVLTSVLDLQGEDIVTVHAPTFCV